MAFQESRPQKESVGRVMHEFKHGELRSGTSGRKVTNPRQAIANALSEAGASNQRSREENRKHFRRTRAKEARGEMEGVARRPAQAFGLEPRLAPVSWSKRCMCS